MDEEGEEAFPMVAQLGLFSPRRAPKRVLNETPRFRSTMDGDVLQGLVGVICKV